MTSPAMESREQTANIVVFTVNYPYQLLKYRRLMTRPI